MTIGQWLARGLDAMPPAGTVGVVSDWFDVGEVDLPAGRVTVADLWHCWPHDGYFSVSTDVPPGRHVVAARGIAFGEHHRVAALRVTLVGSTPRARGVTVGQVNVDSWGVVIGDVETWQAGVTEDDVARLNQSHFGKYAIGCEMATWTLAGRTATFATSFTGLGDGGYPVFDLRDGAGRVVGIECEFIADGAVA